MTITSLENTINIALIESLEKHIYSPFHPKNKSIIKVRVKGEWGDRYLVGAYSPEDDFIIVTPYIEFAAPFTLQEINTTINEIYNKLVDIIFLEIIQSFYEAYDE
jgi:hypothetical protein